MPTYEYKCKACGHQFEIFQFMSDEPLTQCPVCNGEIERLIGAGGGLLFKGSGFYETDYRSDSYKKAAKEETPLSCGHPPYQGGHGVAEGGLSPTEKVKSDTKKEVTASK